MKKLVYILLLMPILFSAQFTISDSSDNWIEIGKTYGSFKLSQKSDKSKAKIEYASVNGSLLTNINLTLHEFVFSTDAETLDKLYNIIKETFEAKKIEEITLEFPEGKMYLNFYKALGSYGFQFRFDNESPIADQTNSLAKRESYGYNMKNINKIFGRK